ncbi:orotidine 5'-phosphate decarboxylase [Bombiscardovia nodaiensis]|uniref:Orotidine 5'-phosphate decarboxylase n=1 Tax=Bombiscardovia nodaiensis TaxID=2932181 RepID=A0ABM8B929_9BIFI|nr:orotidine 5'-phosphate decarboxylase [Bombiscardovia nodaiensis]
MDKLIEAIGRTDNPSVVGLDPQPQLLPRQLLESALSRAHGELNEDSSQAEISPLKSEQVWARQLAQAYWRFNLAVLEGVGDLVPAVKVQIAMYEALGPAGLEAYVATCAAAQERGLYVIGDIKRGDIGSTAAAYACHLSGLPLTYQQAQEELEGVSEAPTPAQGNAQLSISAWHEHAITVNPYLGSDGIDPFVQAAQASDCDLFVLVRTSNPSSQQIQELPVCDSSHRQELYMRVGKLVEAWGQDTRGQSGYSRVGAVVGATHPQAGAQLRAAMPSTFFLVPGFGAQGGSAADVAPMFDARGSGAIVNSSRGIIAAWKQEGIEPSASVEAALGQVASSARQAAIRMKVQLQEALKERS